MFNLFDIMRTAQGGAAFDNIGRQFGLSPQDAQRAVEALLPAFAMGLQRSAMDPNAFANLMGLNGSSRPPGFLDHANLAFSPQGHARGNDVLGHIFGPEASGRIADQAAAWSGVGASAVQQMMPVVAAMLMGGMAAAAQTAAAQAAPPKPPSPVEAWTGMMRQMLGVQPPPPPPPPPSPANPWLDMMQRMTGQPPEPEPPPKPPAGNPFEIWGELFQTGREVGEQHVANLRTIFDQASGGGAKR